MNDTPRMASEQPSPQRIRAYLASALTGLSREDRDLIFDASDVVAEVCKTQGIDLYEPRKITDPVHHPHIADAEVYRLDRQTVLQSDLLFYLAHKPSTGAGQELIFAQDAMIPVVVIAPENSAVSRMVTGMPGKPTVLRFNELRNLEQNLRMELNKLMPAIRSRARAVSGYRSNSVGSRIRQLREEKGLTLEDVAKAARVPAYIDAVQLENWESGSDADNNMSLLCLRELAAALGVSVADLVN